MTYRTERTERIALPLFAGVEILPALRTVWDARDRHGVSQHGELACEADPEAWVGNHEVDQDLAAAHCRVCPIRPECLALGWSETRAGRGGAMYGEQWFPVTRALQQEIEKEKDAS